MKINLQNINRSLMRLLTVLPILIIISLVSCHDNTDSKFFEKNLSNIKFYTGLKIVDKNYRTDELKVENEDGSYEIITVAKYYMEIYSIGDTVGKPSINKSNNINP